MSKELRSEQMVKSMVASLAGQAMSVFLQSKEEQRKAEADYAQELDWARMQVADLQEKIVFLEEELERERSFYMELVQFTEEPEEQEQKVTKKASKKSDAGTPDQEVFNGNTNQ